MTQSGRDPWKIRTGIGAIVCRAVVGRKSPRLQDKYQVLTLVG
jgi:hypothetical protein